MDEKLWSLASYIKISKNRKKLLLELAKSPKMPSELVNKLNLTFATVSKNLKSLKDKQLIYCLNPDQKKGRTYFLTTTGDQVISLLIDTKKKEKLI